MEAVAWLEAVKMDCCSTEKKMNKKTFWIIAGIVIAVLLILVIWQTVKISSISSVGSVASSAVQSASASSSGGMVGGC